MDECNNGIEAVGGELGSGPLIFDADFFPSLDGGKLERVEVEVTLGAADRDLVRRVRGPLCVRFEVDQQSGIPHMSQPGIGTGKGVLMEHAVVKRGPETREELSSRLSLRCSDRY
ncbi:unnamed protein product [Toxocara canis]|uniref:Uncharacterized protein n=1 Tax=Toxocara canis TaxID=6265 RepID=A0A183TX86_TOXCA|nr:unnamed protein product [Toxocara canis]